MKNNSSKPKFVEVFLFRFRFLVWNLPDENGIVRNVVRRVLVLVHVWAGDSLKKNIGKKLKPIASAYEELKHLAKCN